MRLTSAPSRSAASSGSQPRPQTTLMTFQPAPRKNASSSWMILPLPRTGPSRRCRLQLTTKVRLSSSSLAASCSSATRLGLVHLAVAEERPDVLVAGVLDAAVVQVAVELSLVDRVHRAQAHRHGRELPEAGHEPRVRVGRQRPDLAVDDVRALLAEAVEVVLGENGPRGRPANTSRGPRGPGRRSGRRRRGGPGRGRSGSSRLRRASPPTHRSRCARRRPCPAAGPGARGSRRSSGSSADRPAPCPRRRGTRAPAPAGWC
jgi:hypothetical protein